MQELEGIKPSAIQSAYWNDGRLTSANAYVSMLLDIADNAFAKSRNSVTDEDIGPEAFYHLRIFRQHFGKWVDCNLDQGPFVLVHGDFEPDNLLANESMEVECFLDWERSRVVPRQFFKPPLWFDDPNPVRLAYTDSSVANALENCTDIEWFAFRYLDVKCYRDQDLATRVKAFMDEDPSRKEFIKRKLEEFIAYEAELERVQKPSRE
ncbi:hypothetical protein PG994_000169 [Apiospora phragmitis]|uniref:Aminoglycoside phosphotransferase domain-containing protein n=1 Tax=Apiospora phragmitis TaxID=2905665 RepID=A0ABR1X5P0_9PEZI